MNSPVSAVRAAIESGYNNTPDVARVTGLNPSLVAAIIKVIAGPSTAGCVRGSCGGCAAASDGCSGPVMLTLKPVSAGERR